MGSTQIIANISDSELKQHEFKLVRTKKVECPHYTMIGNGRMNKKLEKIMAIDGVKELLSMSSDEQFVMSLINDAGFISLDDKYKYYTTCKVVIDTKSLSNANKVRFSRGYSKLREKDLVRRIKRGGYYMVNPNFIVPTHYESELKEYYELK